MPQYDDVVDKFREVELVPNMNISGQFLASVLLRPQVLSSLLILMATVYWTWQPKPQPQVQPPNLEPWQAQVELQSETIQLTSYDSRGLERPSFITTELPVSLEMRYQKILALLRQELLADIWPENVPEPTVYVYQSGSRRTVILDFKLQSPPAISIAQEWQLFQSISSTLLRNGATDWRGLVNSRETRTFLTHLAVPGHLD